MASALSSAFQGNTIADESSLKPTRAAPPVPSVAYANTVASRAPQKGERPIHQSNSQQHRAQQLAQSQGLSQHPPQQPRQQAQQQQSEQQQQQQQQHQQSHSQQHQQPPSDQQRHEQNQEQYHPGYQPPFSALSHQQQSSFQSRPSTNSASFSQPHAPPTRGRQQAEQTETTASSSTSSRPEYAAAAPPPPPPLQPPPVPPSSLSNQPPQPKKRSGSFSFLRRSSSTQPTKRATLPAHQPAATTEPSSPPKRLSISSSSHHHHHQARPSEGSITSNTASFLRTPSTKGGKSERNMLRKQSKLKQQQQAEFERQQRLSEAANRQPPRLPQHAPLPGIDTFGGNSAASDNASRAYTDPSAPPAMPGNTANFSRPGHTSSSNSTYAHGREASAAYTNGGDYYEPSGERSASMTNRGRYSYASSTAAQAGNVNSPRRVRRRKDPTPFNVLVIGTKNSGKSSFISFLRNSLARRFDATPHSEQPQAKTTFTSQYLETEIDGERVGVTLWDSAGFEKNIVDLQLREMTAFLESKFEETFSEEQKVIRSPGFKDTHIHCVFLVLDPVRLDSNVLATSAAGRGAGGLDEDLDLQVLRALWGKTTVIPVISKADTLTTNHMNFLKRAVWQSVKGAKLNPLDALELDDEDDLDEEDEDADEADGADSAEGLPEKPKRGHARQSSVSSTISDDDPYIPMSILSPDPYSMPPYTKYAPKSQSDIGRRYAWGFASPFDPQHCDFIRLKDTVFSEWRVDLRELSRVKWYEQWRTSRLRHAPQTKSRSKLGSSAGQSLPVRELTDRQARRDYSGITQGVPRTIAPHKVSGAQPAAVGMAVTTDNSRY